MLKEIQRHTESIRTALRPSAELRFVNWYLQHGCDLQCTYCRVPMQNVKVMRPDQRREALSRLRSLSAQGAILDIIGGEPTLRPDLLVDAVADATQSGFMTKVVSNGWGLSPELIRRLGAAGLRFLAISVDSEAEATKSNLARALQLHATTRHSGIVPQINTVISRSTDPATFRAFVKAVLGDGCFLSPIVCSPETPDGVFSNASPLTVPTHGQLRDLVPWLAWQKVKTGRVTASFSYLWTLYNSSNTSVGDLELWHCAPEFRDKSGKRGRGFLTLDSDGFIGPCQEYPRLLNILELKTDELTLQFLDQKFTEVTTRCQGCLFNCYIMEDGLHGLQAAPELPTLIRTMDIFHQQPGKRYSIGPRAREAPTTQPRNL